MDPRISIILPTFNGGRFIKKAIESVLMQSFNDFELFVIDDGSTDNTKKIVESFSDTRINYLKNDKNLGIQKTLNRGLIEAKSKYIARIDDDDIWIDKDKLKKQVEFLDKNTDYILVGTGAIVVDENKNEIFRYLFPETDKEIRNKILSKNCFIHSSVLFRKDIALKFGGYGEGDEVRHVEDYDLWLKLGTLGKLANIKEYSIYFMSRAGNITSQNRIIQAKRTLKLIKKFRKKYPKFLKGYIYNILKIAFFNLIKVFSFNKKVFYRIQKIYKTKI